MAPGQRPGPGTGLPSGLFNPFTSESLSLAPYGPVSPLSGVTELVGWGGSLGAIPYPGDLPDPGLKPESPALQAILYHLSHQGSRLLQIRGAGLTWEAHMGPGT